MLSYSSLSSSLLGRLLDTEYESTTIVRNVGNYLPLVTKHDLTSQTT
jgi:hypothetical protein